MKKTNYIKIVVIFLSAWYIVNCVKNPDVFHFISGVNLVIHEAGHIIFIFFGEFMHVLGGSLNQVLIPALFVSYFFFLRDVFSGGIILMWMGESIVEVARYAADAVVMQLPLLGGGGDNVIHDWNWLFSTMHVLNYTSTISGIFNDIGIFVIITGVVISLYSAFAQDDFLKFKDTGTI